LKKTAKQIGLIVGIALSLSFIKCANQRMPGGGEKDTLSPKLVYYNPTNKQTNVKSNEITLSFNETINTDKLESELIITPIMAKGYKVKSTNRTVKLKFNEPLLDSTTYTLTFRKGITDNTENNPVKNLILVFSTGDKLDSFSILGKLKKLITKSPIVNGVVSVYKTDLDTITESTIPLYQTSTNEYGLFAIDNIKDNNYLIYSYSDINKNYKYDSTSEILNKYRFKKGTKEILNLELFRQNPTKSKSTEVVQKSKSITTEVSNEFNTATITNLKDSTSTIFYRKLGKKLELWPDIKPDTTSDTLLLKIVFEDSSATKSIDTIKTKYTYRLSPTVLPVSFQKGNINQTEKQEYFIETGIPIKKIISDDIEIKIDKRKYTLTELKYKLNENKTKITFKLPSKPIDSLKIKIQPQAILSIFNDTSTYFSQSNYFQDLDSKGILAATVKTSFKNYIVEIIQDNYAVKESFYNIKEFRIKNLDPGTYLIRLIEDKNSNGKWDFKINGQIDPEKIIYQKEKIIMKANWEINDVLITD